MQPTLGAAPLLVIAGALIFQVFHSALVAQSPLRQPSARWWLAFVIGALLFLVARIIQRGAVDPALGCAGSRAQFVLGIWFPVIGIAAIEAHIGRGVSTALRRIAVAAAVMSVLVLTTRWLIVDQVAPRVDLLGERYHATRVTPAGASISVLWVAMAVLAVKRVRALPPEDRTVRRMIRVMAVGFLLTGSNDTLMAAGVIRSVHLFEYALVVPAALSFHHFVRTNLDTQASLASEVRDRTAALASTGQALDRALDELSESEQRLRQLSDASREGVAVLAGDAVTDTNRALRAMFGLTGPPESVTLERLFCSSELPAVRSLVAEGSTRILTTVGVRHDGATFPVEVSAPASEGGAPHVLLVRDVTVQQELQRQVLRADRLAAMGTLAAATAHEINNPLTYVMSNADLLAVELAARVEQHPSLESTRELAADIVSGAERVAVIVRDMVAVAREPITTTGAVELRAVVRESLAMVGHHLRHRATVEVEVGDVPPVRGDNVRLGQVLVNLLINASQAIPDGHADRHRVRIVAASPDPAWVTVRISDTGVGMSREVRDRIFDPFFTTKRVGDGTGLGLSVTLGIVSGLGGRIEVDSEVGRGTTFTLWLPAADAARRPPSEPPVAERAAAARADRDEAGARKGRVLIVDDEPLVARTFARLLAGYDVEVVGSGREAIDRCRRAHYDAIVCDLMMPEITGMEVHAALADGDPALGARMIFVTGGVFTDEARGFLELVPPGRRLTKPVVSSELRVAVADVIATARAPAPTSASAHG